MPNHGNQTQNIPPITSVKDNKVKSAAGIFFEPIEYNIKPAQTKVPWVANKASFLLEDKNWLSFKINITDENKKTFFIPYSKNVIDEVDVKNNILKVKNISDYQ